MDIPLQSRPDVAVAEPACSPASLPSVLFELRLAGLRVLAPDPAAYPSWMLAQGALFVLLAARRGAPAAWTEATLGDLGIPQRSIDTARRRLRIVSLRRHGSRETLWQLPPGLERGADLARFDPRWSRYLW